MIAVDEAQTLGANLKPLGQVMQTVTSRQQQEDEPKRPHPSAGRGEWREAISQLSADRRLEAFRMNDGGWAEQMKNIERHVEQTS